MDTEAIVRRFAAAGLRARVVNSLRTANIMHSGTSNRDVFQMDIGNRGKKNEVFRLVPGAASNRVEPQGIDADLRQLVLMVHEPTRTFHLTMPAGSIAPSDKIVQRIPGKYEQVVVERKTPNVKRHFLVGHDEREYFISQLPRAVTTVARAHEILRPRTGAVERQGEWFFYETTPEEDVLIEKNLHLVTRKSPVGPGGKPHVADERLWIPVRPQQIPTVEGAAWPADASALLPAGRWTHNMFPGGAAVVGYVYVRGKIRHPDHATVEFLRWMKVRLNTERREARSGIYWVD